MIDRADILADNLAGIEKKLARLYARLPAHIEEFCDSLIDPDTAEIGAEELSLSYRHLKEHLNETLWKQASFFDPAVAAFTNALLEAQSPILAAQAAAALAARVKLVRYLPTYDNTPARVAYFRNVYSDKAYKRFSRELSDPTVVYLSSFNAVCEELWADRCDFAILPVESSDEGRLSGVEKLIAKYELSPMFFTRVKTHDGASLRFGLFAASPLIPPKAEAVEILAFADESSHLSRLFTAADYLGCELLDCAALPSERDFQKSYRLVFYCAGNPARRDEVLRALTIFLHCEYPHHLFCGIYRDLP